MTTFLTLTSSSSKQQAFLEQIPFYQSYLVDPTRLEGVAYAKDVRKTALSTLLDSHNNQHEMLGHIEGEFLSLKKRTELKSRSRLQEMSRVKELLLNSAALKSQLTDSAVDCLQDITRKNIQRLKDAEKQPVLLKTGMFYPNEYQELLEQMQQNSSLIKEGQDAIKKQLRVLKEIDAFYHGHTPKCFTLHPNPESPSGKTPFFYLIKTDTLPSEALSTILNEKELIFIDCSMACQIAYYKALETVLGKEKFNALFAYSSPVFLTVGMINSLNPIYLLTTQHTLGGISLKRGDWIFINGPKNYYDRHFNGEGANWNLLCLSSNPRGALYLGLGFSSQGVSLKEVKQQLLNEFNASPIGMKCMSEKSERCFMQKEPEKIKKAESLENYQMDREEFHKQGGGNIPFIIRFNINRIQQLRSASIEEGRVLLSTWRNQELEKLQK